MGHTSESLRSSWARERNTFQAGHVHPARRIDMMQAPAGPRTAFHAPLMPTSRCCQRQAWAKTSGAKDSFQTVMAHSTTGAADAS